MVLTPQMAISHLVMTIGVGISQKKNIKNFDHVQILWNDPYILFSRENGNVLNPDRLELLTFS